MNRALLGEVEFSVVESENPSNTAEITEKPVEKGQDIVDHVKIKPFSMSITGVAVGEDAAQKLQKLLEYFNKGQLLTYVGRNVVTNILIEQFDRVHDNSVSNGFAFSMKLKQVRIATAKEIAIKNPVVKTQMKTATVGLKQPSNKVMSTEKVDELFKSLDRKGLTPNFTGGGGEGGGGGGAGAF